MSYIVKFKGNDGKTLTRTFVNEALKDGFVDMLNYNGFHPLWAEGNYEVKE